MKTIDDLLFSKKLIKQMIHSIDPHILLQKGVKEKISRCAVLATSFVGANAFADNRCITKETVDGVLEVMEIKSCKLFDNQL